MEESFQEQEKVLVERVLNSWLIVVVWLELFSFHLFFMICSQILSHGNVLRSTFLKSQEEKEAEEESYDEPYLDDCEQFRLKWFASGKLKHYAVDLGILLGAASASRGLIYGGSFGMLKASQTTPVSRFLARNAWVVNTGRFAGPWLTFGLGFVTFLQFMKAGNYLLGNPIKGWLG